jgi:lipopolysaccharide export system protein LptA
MQLVAKMVCKFLAAMTSSSYKLLLGPLAALSFLVAAPASAERADRFAKMRVEADQPSKVDIQKRIVTFNGNVVVTKGTMSIRASRIEVRENAEGYQVAVATGSPARFRQKRDGVNEWIEGEALTLSYDSKADVLTLTDQAKVRRLRDTELVDQAIGARIVYDNGSEVFTVAGGGKSATPENPTGRVVVELSPRSGSAAAAAAAEAASQAASAPGNPR